MYSIYTNKLRKRKEASLLAAQRKQSIREKCQKVKRNQCSQTFKDRLAHWKELNLTDNMQSSNPYSALTLGTISLKTFDDFGFRPIKLPSIL